MTFALLKYGLPVLLGYTFFVGVSGRLNPLAYPAYQEERASWLLGIWTGLGLCVALNVGLMQANTSIPIDALTMLKTSAALLALLMVPTIGVYAYSRINIHRVRSTRAISNFNWALTEEQLQQSSMEDGDTRTQSDTDTEQQQSHKEIDTQLEEPTIIEPISKVSPAYLETVHISQLASKPNALAVNDTFASGSSIEPVQPMPYRKSKSHPQTLENLETEQNPATIDDQRALTNLNEKLTAEVALREETEQHLRITRKALSLLEENTRQQANNEADTIIDLEEQLAQSIETAANLERNASEQQTRRLEVEQDLAELKGRMVKAKQQIRHSAAARAKALSTANQSIAFARQSVQIRTRLESELSDAQTTIGNRQKTISSLIRALEKEKRKTQSEIGSMARQIVLQEKQLKARRTLEDVARSVENKLTSRLVKKVAKAKPLMSNMNQADPN